MRVDANMELVLFLLLAMGRTVDIVTKAAMKDNATGAVVDCFQPFVWQYPDDPTTDNASVEIRDPFKRLLRWQSNPSRCGGMLLSALC